MESRLHKLDILIIGAGAIGSLVGSKLAKSGHAVTVAGRPSFAEAVVAHGGLVVDEMGEREIVDSIIPAGGIHDACQQSVDGFDLAILTVKSYDSKGAIQELLQSSRICGHSLPTVVSLQNGVGNEEIIATLLGPAYAIAGNITTPVSVVGPGHIEINKPNHQIGLSSWHPAVSQTHFDMAHQALQEAGFAVVLYPDAQGLKWSKLLINMVGNASSAILGEPPEVIFADKQLVDIEIAAWREAFTVMRAANIPPVNIGSYMFAQWAPLIRWAPKAILRPIMRSQVGSGRGGKMPSLYLDLDKGKPKNEVEWLNGAVAKRGKEIGVPTPINTMLNDVLMELVHKPDKRELWRGDALRMRVTADEYRDR